MKADGRRSVRFRFRRAPLTATALVSIASLAGYRVVAAPGPDDPPGFRRLPGRAVGILSKAVPAVLAAEGRSGPPDALVFSSGGGGERWVYVPDREAPRIGTLSVPVPGAGGRAELERFDGLSLATPETVKRWGVTRPIALVEVEVNGGRGSPAGADRFVATSIKRLDGTPDYPLKPEEVVAALRARHEARLREPAEQAAIEREMEAARRKALGDARPTGPRESVETTRVTWLPDSARLRVEIRARITDGSYRSGQGTRPSTGAPPRPATRYGTAFGVEVGTIYEVDPTGREVSSRAVPPQTFFAHLAPPQGQRAVPLPAAPPPPGRGRP